MYNSSSNLLNRLSLPEHVRQYLSQFPYNSGAIFKYLEGLKARVLVVGESITDEYQYCKVLGKSEKEPILAVQTLDTEIFEGGIQAVAKNIGNFCDVDIFTSPVPIIKKRFVDSYLLQKLFEVYEMTEQELSHEQCEELAEILPQYDIVIVVDYGHGMLNKEAVDILCDKSRFLTVNAQANAGNWGFNTVSKYPRADFATMARHEIMLEQRNHGDIREMILTLSQKCDYGKIAVTCGKDGSICYDGGFAEMPAFTLQVVDRTGTGDAFLAIASLCAAQGAPLEIVGFVGNVAGAIATGYMANKESISKNGLFRSVEALLQ